MSYYSLSSILTTSSKVPTTFNLTVPGLGYLEGSASTSLTASASTATNLKSGSTVPLPLWLSTLLAVSNSSNAALSPFVSLDLPASLSTITTNALRAGPESVDIRSQDPNFYALACQCLELFEEDALVDLLTKTFQDRAKLIADYARNTRGAMSSEGLEFLRGLDEIERELFKQGHEGEGRVREWVASLKRSS